MMKKLLRILTLIAVATPITATAIQHSLAKEDNSVGCLSPMMRTNPVKRAQPRTITSAGFLYESFESVPDDSQQLPEGWTATSTPGLPNDTWHAGTLGRDGTPMNGVSGYKYAYILGNRENDASHDAWLFSPGLQMEAGTEYNIEFFAIMPPVTGSDQMEKLKVCIGNAADKAAMAEELDEIENDNDYWRYYSYSYTPKNSGVYHIGFHSLSPAASNSTAIDDLKISSGPLPIFSGSAEVDLGSTDTMSGILSGSYKFSNGGQSPLEVSLHSASEGVSVEGLPVTLDKYDDAKITVTVNASRPGVYNGSLVLATNDPTLPTVTVNLTGTVDEARVTDYNFENFENGGPEGWKLSHGSGNVAAYGGYNSSRAYYTTTYYGTESLNPGWGGVGFMTHYIRMGDNPEISYWYQMANVDFSGNVTGAAESSKVEMFVQVSEDGGKTFETVYSVKPGSELEHKPTLDFTNVKVSVPQYAGKTCRVRVVFNQPGGASFFEQVRVLADDVSVGTKSTVDLRATSLTGETLLNPGYDYELLCNVENLGMESTSDYSVELIDLNNGEKIAHANGVEIQGNGTAQVKLRWTAEKPGAVKLQARIVSESDPISENNDSYPYIAQILPSGNSVIKIDHGDETLKAMSYPINFYAVEAMTQSIYPANEIGITAGTINSLVFTSCLDSDFYGEPFTVFIAETDQADFASGKMVDPKLFTNVFDGAIYMEAGVNDLVIPFSQSFEYHGGNLVVMCQKLGKEFVMGQYFIVHQTKEVYRSIQASTYQQGTLVQQNYPDLTPNEVYPEIRFNIVKAPSAKVYGKVTDEAGPVKGAMVKVAGTQRSEITDDNGNFSFNEVAEGNVALQVSKHAYYVLDTETFTLNANSEKLCNLTLTKLPRYTLQGTITSQSTGEPIKDVRVQLRGYDNFIVMTDERGQYSITDVAGDCGSDYDIKITNGYFHPQNKTVNIMADNTIDFNLKEKTLRAHNLQVTSTAVGNLIKWDEPIPEFRYDSGDPVDYVGWTHGNSEVIVGAAFYNKARIKEISWYATNRYGNHQNFNVFIFGLDDEGNPDAKKLLYTAKNVKFTDNVWSSHILNQPVEADGFMIAVSCDGFMGLGICEPTDEYTFEEGQAFYAGDSYTSHISVMSSFANVHPMLRAYGDDLGDMTTNTKTATPASVKPNIVTPKVEYKVYLCPTDAEPSEDNLIASTSDCNWLHTSADSGKFRYAVIASYPSGDSEAIYSEIVELSTVETLISDNVSIKYDDSGIILLSGYENIDNIMIVNTAGKVLLNHTNPSSIVDITNLQRDIYIAVITLNDGSVKSYKLNKR